MNSKLIGYGLVMALLLSTTAAQTQTQTQTQKSLMFSSGMPADALIPQRIYPVLKEAFKRNQIEFDTEYHPSYRSLGLSNSGRLDGEIGRVWHFKKASAGAYPNLIRVNFMVTNMLFMAFSKRDLNINSWQDLRNHEVAYLRGQAWTTNKLNKLEMDENLHPVATGTQALKMVAAGRTDIAIVEKNFGDALIRSSEELSTLNVSVILDEIKIYPYIHKKHAALVPALIRSLQGMQEDGSFQRISAQANGN